MKDIRALCWDLCVNIHNKENPRKKGDIHTQGKGKTEEKNYETHVSELIIYIEENIWYSYIQVSGIYKSWKLRMRELNDAKGEMVITAIVG